MSKSNFLLVMNNSSTAYFDVLLLLKPTQTQESTEILFCIVIILEKSQVEHM